MITRIELETSTISYLNEKIKIRTYHYKHFNPVSECLAGEIDINIYFDGKDEKFIVNTLIDEDIVFDTFRDANTYAYRKIYDFKCKLDELVEQVEKRKK